ncbi:hypothetical protein GCM10009557_51770 [Virgisporangium ochraceum]
MDSSTVALKELSFLEEGGRVVDGDPAVGRFIAVPPVGAVVIRALRDGATVGEAAAAAERVAGEPVDVAAFVETLRKVGFVDDESPEGGHRTAAVHLSGWRSGPLFRPLFGRVAWTCYGLSYVAVAVAFAWDPGLMPRPSDAFVSDDVGLSLVVFLALTTLSTAVHECWHWLAAAAAGVPARFGVDRRLYFVVFETDLSQLWRLPRRGRYGPVLAGLAVDGVVLAALTGALAAAGAGLWAPSPWVLALVRGLLLAKLLTVGWQAMVFLRTDLYAVLVIATGTLNLWRVKTLLLRRALRRLDAEGRADLDRANPRDLAVGAWFRWVWLAGFAVAAAYLVGFYVPAAAVVVRYVLDGLAAGPGAPSFWYAAVVAALVLWPHVAVVVAPLRRR